MKYALIAVFAGGMIILMLWWVWFSEIRDPDRPDAEDGSGNLSRGEPETIIAEKTGDGARISKAEARTPRPAGQEFRDAATGPRASAITIVVMASAPGWPATDPASIPQQPSPRSVESARPPPGLETSR